MPKFNTWEELSTDDRILPECTEVLGILGEQGITDEYALESIVRQSRPSRISTGLRIIGILELLSRPMMVRPTRPLLAELGNAQH